MREQTVKLLDGEAVLSGKVEKLTNTSEVSSQSEAKFFITLGAVTFIFTLLLLRKLIPDY
ncbi:MAG: hypothetical protein HQL69_11590 [Magnetococcales bacterium]|nr:hypothetical protein [Magnetococcales bacterium]